MPEFYGLIKKIKQKSTTIQQINIDLYRSFRERLEKALKETDEWLKVHDKWLKAYDEARKKVKNHQPHHHHHQNHQTLEAY